MKLTNVQARQICRKLGENFKRLSYLGRGSHHVHYKLITNKDIYVVRIEIGVQFKNLGKEYYFLKKTKGKFGPKVFLFDDSRKILKHNYLIEEFVEGKHPKKCDTSFIKIMAKYYRRLHLTKTNKPQHQATKDYFFDMWKIYNLYAQKTFQAGSSVLSQKDKEKLENIFDIVAKIVKENRKLFSRTRSLVLKHGDPGSENIYISNGKVTMIDWEFSFFSIPEFELVFFIWRYKLDEVKKKLFLEEYGYPMNSHNQKKFALTMLVHLCEMIAWRVERMHYVKKGKIKRGEYCSTWSEFRKEVSRDIKLIDEYKKDFQN